VTRFVIPATGVLKRLVFWGGKAGILLIFDVGVGLVPTFTMGWHKTSPYFVIPAKAGILIILDFASCFFLRVLLTNL